jgi:hypothetical protein
MKTFKLNKKNKKIFRTLKCSPEKLNSINNVLKGLSCYTNNELFELRDKWNYLYPNYSIITNNVKEIWETLKKNFSKKCYNELCWLKKNKLNFDPEKKDLIKEKSFRPFSPKSWNKKPYEWLSSVDIKKVMTQYEKKYNKFVFIGPSPIDFDNKQLFGSCVWEKLCKFNLNKYYNKIKNKKTKIGIIFNLDPHDKPGSHWVSLFIDLDKDFIFYFDSNGDRVPNRINVLIKRVIDQGKLLKKKLKYYSNYNFEHQMKDGQCGIYSLYFIIELLKENKEPGFFKTERIPDESMKEYRLKYYNYSL